MSILVNITLAITVSVLALGGESRRQDASEPPEHASFPTHDGGLIYANLYGKGDRGGRAGSRRSVQQGELGEAGAGMGQALEAGLLPTRRLRLSQAR